MKVQNLKNDGDEGNKGEKIKNYGKQTKTET